MTTYDLSLWQHRHDFGTAAEQRAERRTRWVVGLTFAAMLVSHAPLTIERYRQMLSIVPGLDHVTIEINHCRQCATA